VQIDEEGELVRGCETEAHRPRQWPAGRLEHEELARDSGFDLAPLNPKQRVGTYLFGAGDFS